MGFINGSFLLLLPFLFINGFGWTAAYASSILLFQNFLRPPAGPISGRLADRFGSAAVILPAAGVSIAAQIALSQMGSSPVVQLVIAALLFWGTSQAMMQTANLRQLYASVPANQIHLAPSLNMLVNSLGGTSGQTFGSVIVDRARASTVGGAAFAGYIGDAMIVITIGFAIGITVTQFLPRLILRSRDQQTVAASGAAGAASASSD
jgi:amino acid permease